jgi:uncharacterized protein (DUF427 family)
MKAIWNDVIIAESGDTVVVEGNHYFPASALKPEYIQPSEKRSICPWKGEASYHHVVVNGNVNENAAWYYSEPKKAAEHIKNRVAFWQGVRVVP